MVRPMAGTADLFRDHGDDGIYRDAVISACRRYRYMLERVWRYDLPWMGFCMLNPSTADANVDDQTIRKCMGFARREGMGGIVVVNACALRSTDPKALLFADAPVGEGNRNYHYIVSAVRRTACSNGLMVVAWGKQLPGLEKRAVYSDALRALRSIGDGRLLCLGTTKDGHPRHPCYLPYNTVLVEFEGAA